MSVTCLCVPFDPPRSEMKCNNIILFSPFSPPLPLDNSPLISFKRMPPRLPCRRHIPVRVVARCHSPPSTHPLLPLMGTEAKEVNANKISLVGRRRCVAANHQEAATKQLTDAQSANDCMTCSLSRSKSTGLSASLSPMSAREGAT